MNAMIAVFMIGGSLTDALGSAAKAAALSEMRRNREQAEARYAARIERWAQLQQRHKQTLASGIETKKILERLLAEERKRADAPPK